MVGVSPLDLDAISDTTITCTWLLSMMSLHISHIRMSPSQYDNTGYGKCTYYNYTFFQQSERLVDDVIGIAARVSP